MWGDLARERGGHLETAKNPLRDTLTIPVGVHSLVLGIKVTSDGNQTQFLTRARVLVPVLDGFTFRVTRANGFTRFWDRFMPGRARLGNPHLEREFRVRTNMGGRVRAFFLDGRVRADLIAARPYRLELARLGWSERRRWERQVRQLQVLAKGLYLGRAEVVPLLALCESALSRLQGGGTVAPRPVVGVRSSVSTTRSRP